MRSIQQQLAEIREDKPESGIFGLLLVDGFPLMEERVVAILPDAARRFLLLTVLTGDDLKLIQTHIFDDG